MKKLFVLGIDAADWGVIDDGIAQEVMPFFARLKEEGAWGVLESTVPPRTCPAWPCFMTGKNPGKVGLYGFVSFNQDYTRSVNSFEDVEDDTYWDVLNRNGMRCGVLNVPVTWPPEIEDGFMVSGLLTPSSSAEEKSRFAVPEELEEKLRGSDFMLEPDIDQYSEDEFREVAGQILESRVHNTLELAEDEEWDCLTSIIRITDPYQHKVWREGKKDKVIDFYEEVDGEVERLVEGIRKQEAGEVNVLIVSDHGFGRIDHTLVHFNTWLKQQGFLSLEKSTGNLWKKLLPLDTVYNLLTKLGFKNLRKYAPKSVVRSTNVWSLDIDWENTKAISNFVEDTGMIYLNREDRFEKGTISKKEYKEVREDIAESLKSIEDPETGEQIVKDIIYPEEVYKGRYVEKAPDLLFKLKDGYRGRDSIDSLFISMAKERRHALHTPRGIIAGIGPDIEEGLKIEDRKIYDIAPTVLHMMGCPVPEDFDGDTVEELISNESNLGKVKYSTLEEEKSGIDI